LITKKSNPFILIHAKKLFYNLAFLLPIINDKQDNMKFKDNSTKILIITMIILVAAFLRLLAIPFPNVAPITAIALFGAAYFKDKVLAFVVPMLAMFITDLVIGLHDTMIFVYVSFALIAIIGFALSRKITFTNVMISGIASSALFFIITNFGVWLTIPGPKNLVTLMVVYELGLPFLRNTLLGDLFFIGVLFGGFEFIKNRVPALQLN
jgi:Family of unknown function (DUF6580)